MLRRLCSASVLALLVSGSIWGGLAADEPMVVTTLDCEATIVADAAGALFREIELGAYRIEAIARDGRSLSLVNHGSDAWRHLAAWNGILEELKAIGEKLRNLQAGWHVLSVPQQRAWAELDGIARQIYLQASETLRALGESTTGVQSEQHVQALLDTRDRSLRMARIVVALDHCGELRMLPNTRVPLGDPESSDLIPIPVWE